MLKGRWIVVFLFLNLAACANKPLVLVTEEGQYKDYTYTIPFDISPKSKKETLADLGLIYEGMPEKDLKLYGFSRDSLIGSYKIKGKKYLVFPEKRNLKKVIIFVAKDGKIIDWFQKERDFLK